MRIVLLTLLVFVFGCGPTTRSSSSRVANDSVKSRAKTKKHRRSRRKLATMPRSMAERCRQAIPLFKDAARRHKLEVGLLVGIARVESGFRPTVVSRAGAVGLMQVMPSTGRHFKCGDLYNVANNAECGARVLRRYIDRYDGDITYGLSAYNAGFRVPNRARKKRRLPKNIGYVEKVLKARARYLRKGCT